MPTITVRPASQVDAAAIGHVHVQAWREAYAGIFPADFLAALDVERRVEGWRQIIELDETRVLLALVGSTPVGWAATGDRPQATAPQPLELEGIYVLQDFYGSGVGQALLDEAIGTAPAYLWMADPNPRAEAFYQRNQFSRDGETAERAFGSATVTTVRLVR